ncbi:MAG: 16S rRNA (guanine(527)-N(7))-methyltransferase RsmG [Flavobacteriales bacterium]
MELVIKYFENITKKQIDQFTQLEALYQEWNTKINVISRKDIDFLYERHVLHALSIAKVLSFKPNSSVMDVGTGGGFPGIPLAILFPKTNFYLIDSIGKKIKVVDKIKNALELDNVKAEQIRVEKVKQEFDFIISRAVTQMPQFVAWVRKKVKKESIHEFQNGILYLKGGDLKEELKDYPSAQIYNIKDFYEEVFYETKKVVYLPIKTRV